RGRRRGRPVGASARLDPRPAAYFSGPRERLRGEIPADERGQAARRQRERSLACLALARCEIEVPIEVARLLREVRPDDDEAVRLQQRPHVDVRQQTLVLRVAGAFEAIELQ